MSDRIFSDPPTVELLQWLCRDSLKQNLPRALRLWVWLHILYGQERDKLELSESFSYADWRDTFFTVSHPKSEEIPQRLIVNYQTGTLPTIEYIQAQMAVAWGFDFYQNANLMLLRFDENHHRRYIQDTVRHDTFERVSYEDAANLLDREIQLPEQRIVLDILKARSTQDAYYKAYYREDDPNVLMRLFAWRPYVEVLFPWKLRQAVANDVRREWEFYQ